MPGITYPETPADADPVLGPILNGFHACVCAVLAECGRGVCTDACCLVPGDTAPPADRCTCECATGAGQAWVRWVGSEPVRPSGGGRGVQRTCAPSRTIKIIEAGVYRCVSVGEGGEPPSCRDRERDTWGLIQDQRLLVNAYRECLALGRSPRELRKVEPLAVKGGCAGVRIEFAVDA